ncbi:hypothetical protein BBJ28_00002933 [Nothophytophthora sp. Chile5]|nr:hypothetical protein BBJ28_00002933 [Nothophytophthora sp. Chile5]
MSFLVAEADEMATLEEALAFIDTWEGGNASDSGSSGAPSRPRSDATQRRTGASNNKKKKRVRSAASSSTVLQRRQKAEKLRLRDQAAELEEQLEQLQCMNGVLHSGVFDAEAIVARAVDNATQSDALRQHRKTRRAMLYSHAMMQYQGRRQAERMNRKLKATLANQEKVNDALRGLLQKRSTLDGIDLVLGDQPLVERPLIDMDLSMAQLEQRVENLYLHAGSVFPSDQLPSISSHTTIKQDAVRGKTMEMVTITPMACSIEDAGHIVWGSIEAIRDRGSRPNSLEKKYVTTVPSRKGDLELKKLNYVRKFEEADRVVIVWGDLILVPHHRLQFRVQSWMAITRSEADPLQGCVARSFLQIFAEPQGDLERQRDEEVVAALFAMLGDIFRQHFQAEQNMMLREAGMIGRTLPIMGY